jgi:uncharacterized tellurite resistance protein B-like protein
MSKSIIEFFEKHLKVKSSAQEAEENKNAIQLAAAIVMFELTQARTDCDPKDREIIIEELFSYFHLTKEAAAILESKAEQADEKLTSLFPYTHLLKENYDDQSKQHLIQALWDIAYQIDIVDKYEEAYLHKIANLLLVPHSQLIHSKQIAEQKYT